MVAFLKLVIFSTKNLIVIIDIRLNINSLFKISITILTIGNVVGLFK